MSNSDFYNRAASTAMRMLLKFGAPATMRRDNSSGGYNPATGLVEGGVSQSWPCTVAIIDYSEKDIDGTLIQSSDRRLLVAPDVAEAPKPGDVFELVSGQVTAVRVSPLSPAGMVVLYDVQVRGE